MKISLLLLLLVCSTLAHAGGDAFEIRVKNFKEISSNEYEFSFTQLSQPYGNEHIRDQDLTVRLRYKCETLFCNNKVKSEENYIDSIELLKMQAKEGELIKFGVIADGYKKIKGDIYQSNGLVVSDGIVYSNSK